MASLRSIVAAKVGPPMVVAAFVQSCVRAQGHDAAPGGQYAQSCERTLPRMTGRILGSDGSTNVCVVVFSPLTERNWSTSCERALFHCAWRPVSFGFAVAYAAKAAS